MPDSSPELAIDLDDPPRARSGGPGGHPDWRRFVRPSTRQTMITAGLAATALLVGYAFGSGRLHQNYPPAAAAQPAAASDQQQELHARLLAPATAATGERVPVLAFHNSQLCGPTRLRFDDAVVEQRIIGYATPGTHTHPQIFLSMDVPQSTKPGEHKIQLIGPIPTTGGTFCADVAERQGLIATATISISVG